MSAANGPHVPYPGEPFQPEHEHDWADGHCQDADCDADDRTTP